MPQNVRFGFAGFNLKRMLPEITWFRHSHENRNDLLRFGMMRLHYQKEIRYTELPFSEIGRFGFTKAVAGQKNPRHLSFLLVQTGNTKVRCLVDNEDSFALLTPLVSEADLCFCAGYNSDFFVRQQFVTPYAWQDEVDLCWYRKMVEEKIATLGPYFNRVRKFIPIAPNQGGPLPVSAWKQKFKNLAVRLNRTTGKAPGFADVYQGFEAREAYLNMLRNHDLAYDIVLNDSLWGWPQHRINLHRKLEQLQNRGYKIHSLLNWTPPVEHDGSNVKRIDPAGFPVATAPIHLSYELMLAQSRLAVFACGFHWGWRNIMLLALRTGIPVLTDRLLTEPYFDMNEFCLTQQEDQDWNTVEPELNKFDETRWQSAKLHNQAVYDKYMSPEAVAHYFLKSAGAIPGDFISSPANRKKDTGSTIIH